MFSGKESASFTRLSKGSVAQKRLRNPALQGSYQWDPPPPPNHFLQNYFKTNYKTLGCPFKTPSLCQPGQTDGLCQCASRNFQHSPRVTSCYPCRIKVTVETCKPRTVPPHCAVSAVLPRLPAARFLLPVATALVTLFVGMGIKIRTKLCPELCPV
jgi:hypothetical protein